MKIPISWLCDYTKIEITPNEFQHEMTMTGTKVEAIDQPGGEIINVVTGRVLSVEQHPDADKLVVCQVDVVTETIQIVTGAQNLYPGAVVPVAKDGSTLPGGVKIKKGKLRGVESFGMMCSDDELFPGRERADGIMILPDDTPLGRDVREVLGLNETIAEFELTSNRPDCQSVIGIAREAAATFNQPFSLKTPEVKNEVDDIKNYADVEVKDYDLCPRYTARVVKNIKIAPSPKWLQARLELCGVRPINNIVDITNYIMLEYGQPMHAFDLRDLAERKIIVRRAVDGEKITTLDDQDRILTAENLVIADAARAVAVAGVMGGQNSEIKDDTTEILFESANFLGSSVRRTAKSLGLRTEASARYEKGLSAEMTLDAVNRACELVEQLGAGEVVGGVIDCRASTPAKRKIPLDVDGINKFLGTKIPRDFMEETLIRLNFEIEGNNVVVPHFREDVEGMPDLAEEVARFYGYDNIKSTLLRGETTLGARNEKQLLEANIRDNLIAQGLHEIQTYSFVDQTEYDLLGQSIPPVVKILNPLGTEHGIMRTNTIGSMLTVLKSNYNYRTESAALFELGKVYIPKEGQELPEEKIIVTIGMYGPGYDYYSLKGIVDNLISALGITYYDIERESSNPTFHPGQTANLSIHRKNVVTLGKIHPDVQTRYDIGAEVFLAVLDLDQLLQFQRPQKKYKPLPKYPAMTRDIAFILSEEVPVRQIEDVIRSQKSNIIEESCLFDVYRGKQLGKGQKSVAYSIKFRAPDRTLTDEEVSQVMKSIEEKAKTKLGATIRDQ